MADLKNTMKSAWLKGMEAIGNTATSIANGTKTKVKEMNLVSRRSEIMSFLSSKLYELWQKGEPVPEELDTLLHELAQVDVELNELRAARVDETAVPEAKPVEEEADAEEEVAAEEDETVAPEQAEEPEVAYTAAEEESKDE